jgi:protein gp37
MIFVSDMGDALSRRSDFAFLKREVIGAMRSVKGSRHLWLWLTKRPGSMAALAAEIGGLPPNACAMTTVTGADPERLKRIDELRSVDSVVRGLSIEPLWERIPAEKLDLTGIDWVIVGGESGSGDLTRPFALEWAEEIRDHCRKNGVAFFLKQLGRNPTREGQSVRLNDPHGGDWNEWEEELRVREFPPYFHNFRNDEIPDKPSVRSIHSPQKKKKSVLSSKDTKDFQRLDRIVRKGVEAVFKMGEALTEIKDRALWQARYSSWEKYCESVVGHSRSYVHRIIAAARIAGVVEEVTLPNGDKVNPLSEAQMRPLARIKDPEDTRKAWRIAVGAAVGQPTAEQVEAAVVEVLAPATSKERERSRGEKRKCLVTKLEVALADASPEVRELLSKLKDLL